MSKVIIKSTKNGINLIVEDNCSFEELIDDVTEKFIASRSFFGKAKMALTVTGRKLTIDEEKILINTIAENSDITILCLVSYDEADDRIFLTALDMLYKQLQCDTDTLFLEDSLINKENIETEKNVIIMGDINPGCRVESGGNVVVFGGIYGEVAAKSNGYIAGLDIQPERLHIGSCHLPIKKPSKWPARPKYNPCVVVCQNNECVKLPLTRELLNKLKTN